MKLEEFRPALDRTANSIRKQLREESHEINATGGFSADFISHLVDKNLSLEKQLDRTPTEESKDVKNILKEIDNLMKSTAASQLNQRPLPNDNLNLSIGKMALRIAHDELTNWKNLSIDQRLNSIFKYLGVTNISRYDNWCAAFVSWCLDKVPNQQWQQIDKQKNASVIKLLKAFKADPTTRTYIISAKDGLKPAIGDVVFWWRESFNSGYGHIGFVFDISDEHVITIEGNVSMSITLCEYKQSEKSTTAFYKDVNHGFLALMRLP
jgi:CHAP domain